MKKSGNYKLILSVCILVILILCLTGLPVFAWFYMHKSLAAYAPVSSPESLYIGSGHCEPDRFEDIRYLYFESMNAREDDYWDYVFCVYGKSVPGYKLQLAFTTNNQFTYEIYNATESSVDSEGAIEVWTHTDPSVPYYYTLTGDAIGGNYLNSQVVDGETIANSTKHAQTYRTEEGSYDNVQYYAEPIYWQTSTAQSGNARGTFVNYYILRVIKPVGMVTNNRETDILCLAAKSASLTQE